MGKEGIRVVSGRLMQVPDYQVSPMDIPIQDTGIQDFSAYQDHFPLTNSFNKSNPKVDPGSHFFLRPAFLTSASNPERIWVGVGGLPGIFRSTGNIVSAPPKTA